MTTNTSILAKRIVHGTSKNYSEQPKQPGGHRANNLEASIVDAAIQHRDSGDPHANQPVLTSGPAPENADAAIILLHGRGGTAASILSLLARLQLANVAALAPQAADNSWYPQSFLAPIDSNQPKLDSALRRIDVLVAELLARGVTSDRIAILGFSQGACLTSEYTARHPRRYGAIMPLTGGLVGPPGTPRTYTGSLDGTPVFMGTSDPDPHVPFERVQETADVLEKLGAAVELRRYPGMPHTINEDELLACRALLEAIPRP